jgi:hypothetical protein
MTESRSLFQAWMDAYQDAWIDPSSVPTLRCPSCESKSLRLIFLVKDSEAENGKAAFWCGNCLNGLIPMRAPLPSGGTTVREGEEVIPNYRLVVDDGADGGGYRP